MDVEARYINEEMVGFIETNVKKFPGEIGIEIQYYRIEKPGTGQLVHHGRRVRDE